MIRMIYLLIKHTPFKGYIHVMAIKVENVWTKLDFDLKSYRDNIQILLELG